MKETNMLKKNTETKSDLIWFEEKLGLVYKNTGFTSTVLIMHAIKENISI